MSRPRRHILLWAGREEQASELAFVLNLQPKFWVTTAGTDYSFQLLLSQRQWDLVIIPHAVSPRRTANKAALAKRVAGCAVMILTWEQYYLAPEPPEASCVLPWGVSTMDLIERAKVLTARKRGPKPQRKPIQAVRAPFVEAAYGC